MKKSSAFIMVVPGLVILAVCLFLPLLRVLIPSFHTGDYPFSAYVEFFQDEYYLKIFMRTVKVAFITTAVCMTAGVPTAYFISRCRKKMERDSSVCLNFSSDDQFCHQKLCLDQYFRQQRHH
uniref:hypothetical protein n=1 Tax=Clostridium sp. NkU-1 TaxID=1095009 RepID=UPI0032612E8D